MSDLILHHYDFSNYSEKVRLALGYKGLAWRSVIIPPIAPKPSVTPLTGGYRRTPVLQVGSDIYCDTRLILRELERRQPAPTLYPPGHAALADAVAYWAENELFRPISLFVSGSNPELFPPSLQADRSAMRDIPAPDTGTMQRAALRSAPITRVQIARIESVLSDGRTWILGTATTVADFAIYHALWFIAAHPQKVELAAYPRLTSWMERVRAFGHARNAPMSPDEALAIAAATTPAPMRSSSRFAEDPPLGAAVRVRADDYARDPVVGELVLIDADEIAVRREDPRVGEIVVHFPRLGYDLRRA
jgi:glutathione S-transferase